jgi:signal transduction histidine kinase
MPENYGETVFIKGFMSFLRKNDTIKRTTRAYDGSFLQPIAVGIVSAILVALILIMGFLDMRRSETNLIGLMEGQALSTISVLQRLTEENLKMIIAPHMKPLVRKKSAREDEASYFKKFIYEAITSLAREIDELRKKNKVNDEYLKKLAAENHLWYAAVLGRSGDAIYQSRDLKADVADLIPYGQNPTTMELLEMIREKLGIGFLVLQRFEDSDIIVINLDKHSGIYWGLKVSVERAVDKMGEANGIVYLQIFNNKGQLLSMTGSVPEELMGEEIEKSGILSGKEKIKTRKLDTKNDKILDITTPFFIYEKIEGYVRIGLDRSSMDAIMVENRQNIVIFMLLVVVIALVSMWLLFRDQNRHLAGIVDMERRLEKAERLSSLGMLAAGVAHEIRNPLNAISMAAQRLKRDFVPDTEVKSTEFQNLSGVVRDEIRRLNAIIEEFLTFSKSRRLELSDFSVTEVLQKIVQLVNEEAVARNITLETKWPPGPMIISMDVNKLQQAFLNFIKNGLESITGRGKITIKAEKESKNSIRVSISDTGCGMSEEEMEKIFNPEYTTKEKGLGLGMPLAMEIIRGHGGDVQVTSRRGQGTTFEIILPVKKSDGQN